MTILKQPQFNEKGQQVGEIIICRPNRDLSLEEKKCYYYDNLKNLEKATPSIQFHTASTLTNNTDTNDNRQQHKDTKNSSSKNYSNAFKMCSLMKRIVGEAADYYYSHNYDYPTHINKEAKPEFHKGSTTSVGASSSSPSLLIREENNSSKVIIRNLEFMKKIVGDY
jgi:hypothetical protein